MMKHFTASPELNALREQTEALEDINKSFKTALEAASAKMQESLKNEQKNNASRTNVTKNAGNGTRYSKKDYFVQDKYFESQINKWEQLSHGSYVKVGIIGDNHPLVKIGMPQGVLRYDISKLQKNMKDHSDYLTTDLLKVIPGIIANPIAISQFSTQSTVSVFGNYFVGSSPMMVGVTISKDRAGNDITKVRTFNARKDVGSLITDEKVLYLNEDKKRTQEWFQACGIQVPLGGTQFGFIRSISHKTENSNTQNRKSIKIDDSKYLSAVENGNMETAQKLIEDAAKKAGYTIKAYHGTPNGNFTVFDARKIGSNTDSGIFGSGFYFTTHEDTAGVYATENGHIMPVYLKVNNPWWAVSHRNIQEVAEELGMDETAFTMRGYGGKERIVTPTMSQTGQFSEHLQGHGYDAVVVQHGSNNYEIVVFDSNIIKSADTVTYANDGNVIPLSERFKDDKNDIRYSLKLSSAGEKLVQSSPELQMVFKDLQKQTKLSNGYIPEAKKIHSYAYELKKTCQSTLNVAEIENDLRNIYEVLSSRRHSNNLGKNCIRKSNIKKL